MNTLPRFALTAPQIKNVIRPERVINNIYADSRDIVGNPYLLSEQYAGDDIDDSISFNTVDHGILPSPELGLDNIFPKNSAER